MSASTSPFFPSSLPSIPHLRLRRPITQTKRSQTQSNNSLRLFVSGTHLRPRAHAFAIALALALALAASITLGPRLCSSVAGEKNTSKQAGNQLHTSRPCFSAHVFVPSTLRCFASDADYSRLASASPGIQCPAHKRCPSVPHSVPEFAPFLGTR